MLVGSLLPPPVVGIRVWVPWGAITLVTVFLTLFLIWIPAISFVLDTSEIKNKNHIFKKYTNGTNIMYPICFCVCLFLFSITFIFAFGFA